MSSEIEIHFDGPFINVFSKGELICQIDLNLHSKGKAFEFPEHLSFHDIEYIVQTIPKIYHKIGVCLFVNKKGGYSCEIVDLSFQTIVEFFEKRAWIYEKKEV